MPRFVFQQFGVRPSLDDLAVIHHQDAVRVAHRGQSMGNDNDRTALADGLRRILEVDLNVIEFGNGIYCAEAAARRYYKASATNLNRDQAARMAAMVPNPRWYENHRSFTCVSEPGCSYQPLHGLCAGAAELSV